MASVRFRHRLSWCAVAVAVAVGLTVCIGISRAEYTGIAPDGYAVESYLEQKAAQAVLQVTSATVSKVPQGCTCIDKAATAATCTSFDCSCGCDLTPGKVTSRK